MLKIKNITIILLLWVSSYPSIARETKVCAKCETTDLITALKRASAHDTIRLLPGVYAAVDIELDKSITLYGEPGAILDGQNKNHILKLSADSIAIVGLKFINSGRSFTKDYAAIYAHRVNYFQIENNVIDQPFFGLLIEKSHHGVIKNNLIHGVTVLEKDAGNGIHLWHCSDVTVQKNETFGLRDGLYFEFVTESLIEDNYSHNNVRYGLHFMFSNHNEYTNNTFQNNGAGVAVMFSKFIIMKNNVFAKNWGTASYGLLLKEIYDAEVIDNRFEENTIAIFLEGTGRINYLHNEFYNNGWAVKVSGGCYTNIFESNNFVNNALDIAYNSKINDNEFRYNYWSSYTGYDLDRDGTGDVPYRPVKLFSYIISQTPESIILLRSLFVDIINFSEKVSPIFTPDNLMDHSPAMQPIL